MNKKELKNFILYHRETPYAFLKDYCATNLAWYQKIFVYFVCMINNVKYKNKIKKLKKYINKLKYK